MPPLNLVGDFGGGALYLALGVVAGLLEAQKSGKGQVVDAAMVDGASSLMTAIYGIKAAGVWTNNRGENLLDTGAHFYEVYETSDGKFVSIGSIEATEPEPLPPRNKVPNPADPRLRPCEGSCIYNQDVRHVT